MEPYWENGSAIKIIESVFNSGNTQGTVALLGVGIKRNVNMLSLLDKKWEIWRQK